MAHALLLIGYGGAISLVVMFGTLAQLLAGDGPRVIAVFAPTMDAGAVLAATTGAGAIPLRFGRYDWLVELTGVDAAHRGRLGALFLLDADRAAALCGIGTTFKTGTTE